MVAEENLVRTFIQQNYPHGMSKSAFKLSMYFSVEWHTDIKFYTKIVPLYRQISILSGLYRTSVSPIIIPVTKIVTCMIAFFGIFGSIRFGKQLSLQVFAFFPLCAVVFVAELTVALTFMARLYYYSSGISSNFLSIQFEDVVVSKAFRKTVKSLRPIRFPIGSIYFVNRTTMLTVLYFLVDRTIQLLVAIPTVETVRNSITIQHLADWFNSNKTIINLDVHFDLTCMLHLFLFTSILFHTHCRFAFLKSIL